MNFGEKFPYALLTFSQMFHARTPSPKSLSKLVIGYTIPQSLPARPAPHQLHTPHTHTNYTPTIPPIPLPCELTATK